MSDFDNLQGTGGDFGAASGASKPMSVDARAIQDEMRQKLRGRIGLGLVGYPNAGKTSYLYSLKTGADAFAKGKSKWEVIEPGEDFKRLTGTPGETAEATPETVFTIGQYCRMRRRLTQRAPVGPSFMVCMPEVSGEIAKAIGQGSEDSKPQLAPIYERFKAYLGDCDALMCLVALNGGREDESQGWLRPDQALADAFNGFGVIIGETTRRRRKKKKTELCVTILITKADLLRDHALLDSVSLDAGKSSVGRLAKVGGRDWLRETVFPHGAERVDFSVDTLSGVRSAGGDLDLHEAIAADFLKCHAPRSAKLLEALCKRPGVSVRFYLSNPYGNPHAILPQPSEIRPRMVFEPTVDALERAWVANEGHRLRRKLIWAAILAVLLILLGPLTLRNREIKFESIPASEGWSTLAAARKDIEAHPLHWIESWISEGIRLEHAARLLKLRERMIASDGKNTEEVQALENAILANYSPDAVVEDPDGGRRVKLSSLKQTRDSEYLQLYLLKGGEGKDPKGPQTINADGSRRICDKLSRFGAADFQVTGTNAPREMKQRLDKVLQGLNASPARSERDLVIQCEEGRAELLAQLRRLQSLIDARIAMDAIASDGPNGQALRGAEKSVISGGDRGMLATLDRGLEIAALDAWKVNMASAQTPSQMLAALDRTLENSNVVPAARDLVRQRAALWFDMWLEAIGSSLSGVGFDGKDVLLKSTLDEIAMVRESPRHAWMMDRAKGGVDARIKLAIDRSDVIRFITKLAPSEPMDGFKTELSRLFGPRPSGAVVWKRLDDDGEGKLDLSSYFLRQRDQVLEVLRLHAQGGVIADEFSEASLLVDVGLIEELFPEQRDLIAKLTLARSVRMIGGKPKVPSGAWSDEAEFKASAPLLVKTPDFGRQALVKAVGRSPNASRLLPLALDAAAASLAPAPAVKRALGEELVNALGDRWAEFPDTDLIATVKALWATGLTPNNFLPEMLATKCRVCLDDAVGPVEQDQARKSIVTVLDEVLKLDSDFNEDVAVKALKPVLSRIEQEMKAAKDLAALRAVTRTASMQLFRALNPLINQHGAMRLPRLAALPGIVDAHVAKVDKWGLLRAGAGAAPCWLGRTEWNIESLQLLDSDDSGRIALQRAIDEGSRIIRNAEGTIGLREAQGDERGASLRLSGQMAAMDLVGAAGLRLPTNAELNAERGPALDPMAVGADKNEDGFEDLQQGVREFVSNRPHPAPVWGRSSLNKTEVLADKAPYSKAKDVGIRPALDIVPPQLRELLRAN